MKVKVGDNVSEGSLIVVLEGAEGGAAAAKPAAAQANGAAAAPAPAPAPLLRPRRHLRLLQAVVACRK